VKSNGLARVAAAAAVAAALVSAGACKWNPAGSFSVDDESQPPLSVLRLEESRADTQLLSGFHELEQGAWRWTMRSFAVALQPPPDAARSGARLALRFILPDSVMSRRKTVTLSASVAQTVLPPETYTKAGDYTYARDVPSAAFLRPPVKVVFRLDHFLEAGEVDPRELGLVVSSVGLVAR
jgi:hypothetical protein